MSVRLEGEVERVMPKPVSTDKATEVVANPEYDRRLRRRFSAEDKRRILEEAEACSERGQLSALLRREQLYSSQLATWRAQLEQEGQRGLQAKKPGRKPLKDAKDRRIEQLEHDKSKLERRLLIAEKLIELQKKAQELLAATQSADKP
jgi:transposase